MLIKTLFNILFILPITIASVVLFLLFVIVRRWLYRRIELLVQSRVKEAIKVKDLAMRIKSGFNGGSIIQEDQQNSIKTFKYKSATVLFADIQGFTKIVEKLSPEKLIDELDSLFIYFDHIIERYGVEKIKTIGDAYMAASGIPKENSTHAIEMVLVAIEFQQYMHQLRQKKNGENEDFWELRIGIDSGPLIAGRLGHKKSNFDIWGDTVNTASRMEASCLPNEINITDSTYQMIKELFVCEYRGQMPVKYKGTIDMYFVKGIRPELSIEGLGVKPNEKFQTHLQMARFIQMESAVLDRLDKELPPNMLYHNSRHTMDVITQVEVIARNEKVSNEDLLLLKSAALLHDTGFLMEYKNHEYNSTIIATDVLKGFGYSQAQIDQINKLIIATHPNHNPTNLLEMIIKDADLDYLGRSDFFNLSNLLLDEIQYFNGKIEREKWQKQQLKFMNKHEFYTKTGKLLREKYKLQHIQKLKEIIVHEK